jgi:hypothetical protein
MLATAPPALQPAILAWNGCRGDSRLRRTRLHPQNTAGRYIESRPQAITIVSLSR